MKLVFASSNPGKIKEVRRVAASRGCDIVALHEVQEAKQLPAPPVVAETESTYESNSALKALWYARWCQQPCLTDDSGVELDALGALPGVYTARFPVQQIMKSLGRSGRFPGRFVCCISYAEPVGRLVSVTATLEGVLELGALTVPAGSTLPYSYLFIPEGERVPLSQLIEQGDFLSHRGRALRALLMSLA